MSKDFTDIVDIPTKRILGYKNQVAFLPPSHYPHPDYGSRASF
jgi:hypothetical protein